MDWSKFFWHLMEAAKNPRLWLFLVAVIAPLVVLRTIERRRKKRLSDLAELMLAFVITMGLVESYIQVSNINHGSSHSRASSYNQGNSYNPASRSNRSSSYNDEDSSHMLRFLGALATFVSMGFLVFDRWLDRKLELKDTEPKRKGSSKPISRPRPKE